MRVTAGQFRGRVLQVPDLPGLRPTPSKVRQALFNMLGDVSGYTILDLFSGSGIMTIEALSRDAASAVSIEQNGRAVQSIKTLKAKLAVEQWQVMKGQLPGTLKQLSGNHFELIFADPPYEQGFSEQIPIWLDQSEISCDQLVIEESARVEPNWPQGWTMNRSRRYGDTKLFFLEKGT